MLRKLKMETFSRNRYVTSLFHYHCRCYRLQLTANKLETFFSNLNTRLSKIKTLRELKVLFLFLF
jgi:hypothetical protein